jgi:hypothetical protein
LYVNLLVLRPDAGAGFSALLLQSVIGRSEVETGLLLTLAAGDHGDGTAGRLFD